MKRSLKMVALVLAVLVVFSVQAQAGHRIGGGVQYLKTLGDIKDHPDFDEHAFGFLASYQFAAGLFKIEGDIEWIPDFGGTDKSLWQPQAYALLGGLIYGGVGIGSGYFDGDWFSEPFYALRVGVDLALGGLDFDVFTLYRFQDAEFYQDLGESSLDSLTFAALIRFAIGD